MKLYVQQLTGYKNTSNTVAETKSRLSSLSFSRIQPSSITPMEVIHETPTSSSFTPLAVHQSQTPESFYTGPPVLYHHSPSAFLSLHASDLAAAPALSNLANGAHRSSNGTSTAAVNGDSAAEEAGPEDEDIEIAGVDVWVTSEFAIP